MIKKIILGVALVTLFYILIIGLWITSMLFVPSVHVGPVPETLPDTLGSIATVEEWELEKIELLDIFESEIYGEVPTTQIDWTVEEQILDTNYLNISTFRQLILRDPENTTEMALVMITPNNKTNASFLVVSSFCANPAAWPEFSELKSPDYYPSFCNQPSSPPMSLVGSLFGEYIGSFPDREILERGFGIVSIYPGDLIPDSSSLSPQKFKTVNTLTGTNSTGAIAVWAWGHNEVVRVVGEQFEELNELGAILYGHSRAGKTVLLAGAVNENIAGVISHQAGTYGTALTRSHNGESVVSITNSYGYWFSPKAATYEGREDELPIDQHQLIAMIAPRPLLVTGSRWDKWSDPEGTLMAVREADEAYELYGSEGTTSTKLDDNNLEEDLAFYFGPASHGVRGSDWDAFFTFIDHHFAE